LLKINYISWKEQEILNLSWNLSEDDVSQVAYILCLLQSARFWTKTRNPVICQQSKTSLQLYPPSIPVPKFKKKKKPVDNLS